MAPEPDADERTEAYSLSSGLIAVGFEPVGRWFEAYLRRKQHATSVSLRSSGDNFDNLDDDIDDEDDSELSEDDKAFLISLDSNEWKKQDHYRVLGIADRFSTTEDEIKKAYRKKVLLHHPDKKGHRKKQFDVPGLNHHEYFTCITKAYEILSNSSTRRAYDSIDPNFNDDVPTTLKGDFFEVFKPVFERNARWSVKSPVPSLGDLKSSEEHVNQFYMFWYDFESWREYSYLDDEDKDTAESREERRWMEKQNRRKRQARKKEELARIRLLVETSYTNDPRIRNFAEERKLRKLQEKKAKEEALREKERLRLEAEEAERKMKEKADLESKEKAAKEKKEREKSKKTVAKERKTIRQIVKDNNYFVDSEENLVEELEKLERTLDTLSLESLQLMRSLWENRSIDELKNEYQKHVSFMESQIKEAEEKLKLDNSRQNPSQEKISSQSGSKVWSEDEMQLLVKATVLFPPGTASRWQVIANYINEHAVQSQNRTAKQVIGKAKSLQKMDPCLKEDVNKRAFEKLRKETSEKLAVQPVGGVSLRDDESTEDSQAWTSEEQKLLEQALKTFPASTPERWDKIAEAVATRSKKECIKRCKVLIHFIRFCLLWMKIEFR